MSTILAKAQKLLELISKSMPTVYQQETVQSIIFNSRLQLLAQITIIE